MFSTVFIDISLIFVQLGLENFWKTVRDPPFITFARVPGQICFLYFNNVFSLKSNCHKGAVRRNPDRLKVVSANIDIS